MERLTLEQVKAIIGSGVAVQMTSAHGEFNKINLVKTKVKGGDGFGATVQLVLDGDEGHTALIADSANGKIKIFKNVDDAYKSLAAFGLLATIAGDIKIANPEVLDAPAYTGSAVAKAISKRKTLQGKSTTLANAISKMNAEIALTQNVTPSEQLLYNERVEQRDAMVATKAFDDAQIAAITAVVGA